MPANLPPQYFKAEKNFRTARTNQEKMAALEDMLAIMPRHKGTDHLRADLRRRIAKLTQAVDKKSATQRASILIPKEGAAQIVVIGPTNAGKSQLVSQITNATSPVADYPFTTYAPIPGMMEFENIQIQLIDTPPLAAHATESWFSPTLMRADALLIVLDLSEEPLAQMAAITEKLEKMRFTINREIDEDSQGLPLRYKKALIVGNKTDLNQTGRSYAALENQYQDYLPVIGISAEKETNLEELKVRIYQMLDILRVYTKTPGEKPDYDDPITLPRGSTLDDAAASVHKDFRTRLKYARLWGSGKHDGIMVKRDHILEDGDVIELHM